MKRKHMIGILAVVALLGSCNLLGLGNPFVGAWTGDAFGPITYTFNSDMTYDQVGSGYTDAGVYDYTAERLTLTSDDGDVTEMLYEFRDGLLELTPTSGIGLSLVLSPVD